MREYRLNEGLARILGDMESNRVETDARHAANGHEEPKTFFGDQDSLFWNDVTEDNPTVISLAVISCLCDTKVTTEDYRYDQSVFEGIHSEEDIQMLIDNDAYLQGAINRVNRRMSLVRSNELPRTIYRGFRIPEHYWYTHIGKNASEEAVLAVLGNQAKRYNSFTLKPSVAASYARKMQYIESRFVRDQTHDDGFVHIVISGTALPEYVMYPKTAYMIAKFGDEYEVQINNRDRLPDMKVEIRTDI